MTTKYFKRSIDELIYRVFETTDAYGNLVNYALQLDAGTADMLGVEEVYGWTCVEESDVKISNWFIDPETDEYGMSEEDYHNEYDERDQPPVDSGKLKRMLEGLRLPRPDDEMNHHERLKASFDESNRNEDILGMIRARGLREVPPTIILNPKKYLNADALQNAIESIRNHAEDSVILLGNTSADASLASMKNQETIGISSVPQEGQELGISLDPEILDIVKLFTKKK